MYDGCHSAATAADPATHPPFMSSRRSSTNIVSDAEIMQGLRSVPIQVMAVDQDVDGSVPVKVDHLKFLGSYDWVDAPQPTILVPGTCAVLVPPTEIINALTSGCPSIWRDRPLPFDVPYDMELQLFDPTGYNMGLSSTLIPLFRAVDAVTEDNGDTTTDWAAVDFVLDRSSMRKLLRWVRYVDSPRNSNTNAQSGTPSSNPAAEQLRTAPSQELRGSRPPPDFRLDLQLGGEKTVLVDRLDPRNSQHAQPPQSGHRSNFDRMTTAPANGSRSSKYHHRIVQYDLEGFRMVVRFEVDACIQNEDDVAEQLASLTLSSLSLPASRAAPSSTEFSENSLRVLRGGTQIPQSSLIEITTRSYTTHHKWYESYSQLLLSQTPYLYFAMHHKGRFDHIARLTPASPQLARFDHDAYVQRSLHQLVRVLGSIAGAVRAYGHRGGLTLVCREGTLELFERSSSAQRLPDSELGGGSILISLQCS
ncbi:hypothetical protein BD413DRAFT_278557 [Trametes elegans]|nr:hypothetical protein BD413DRAFT_278557 [Trametes elegans]